jgi:hypothetical protein
MVSAQDFANFDLQELTQLLHKISRGRFGAEKAQQIQKKTRQSISVDFLADAAHVKVRCLLAQIDLLEEQQAEVEKAQGKLMQAIPQYITTISGIALPTGATILSEIRDVARRLDPGNSTPLKCTCVNAAPLPALGTLAGSFDGHAP